MFKYLAKIAQIFIENSRIFRVLRLFYYEFLLQKQCKTTIFDRLSSDKRQSSAFCEDDFEL